MMGKIIRACVLVALACAAGCKTAEGETSVIAPLLLISVFAIPIGYIAFRMAGAARRERDNRSKFLEAHAFLAGPVKAGTYVSGHPNINVTAGTLELEVAVTDGDFAFITPTHKIAATIPRGAPTDIEIVDASRTQVTSKEKVSLTRVAVFGVVGLAFPKTEVSSSVEEKYVVGIGWTYNGVAMTMAFAFRSANDANRLAGFIAKHRSGTSQAVVAASSPSVSSAGAAVSQPAVVTRQCANCGTTIGALERAAKWDEHLVCVACHRRLSA